MLDVFKYAAVLASVSCLSMLPVSFVHRKTARHAAEGREALLTDALKRVVPAGATPLRKTRCLQGEQDSTVYWMATSGEDTTYSFTVETFRYPGRDLFVVVIGADHIVKGMCAVGGAGSEFCGARQTSGARHGIAGEIKKKSKPRFTDQFVGLSVDRSITVNTMTCEWPLLDDGGRRTLLEKNEITPISGAIGSARDIANAVTVAARQVLKAIRS